MSGGYSNETWRVDARAGAFVARRYGRLHVTRAAVAFEHAVVAHAAAAMPEVVAPLHDALGATLRLHGGGLVAAWPFVDGETGRRDLDAAREAARVLARFHRAMHDVHVAGGMRSTRFVGTFAWLRERFARFAADPVTGRVLDWDALVAAVTAATARIVPLAASLPHVVVHGDPHPDNVVSSPSGTVRALIDFDFAHETERLYDLGAMLDAFCRAHEDAPLDPERIAPLLDAYAEEAPIARAERGLMPEAMLRRAATMTWYVATRHGERMPGDVGGAPRYAARAAEIVRRAASIREAAGG